MRNMKMSAINDSKNAIRAISTKPPTPAATGEPAQGVGAGQGGEHKCVYDSDILPMQYGENLPADVERMNSLFCACGRVNHYGTWLPQLPPQPAPPQAERKHGTACGCAVWCQGKFGVGEVDCRNLPDRDAISVTPPQASAGADRTAEHYWQHLEDGEYICGNCAVHKTVATKLSPCRAYALAQPATPEPDPRDAEIALIQMNAADNFAAADNRLHKLEEQLATAREAIRLSTIGLVTLAELAWPKHKEWSQEAVDQVAANRDLLTALTPATDKEAQR